MAGFDVNLNAAGAAGSLTLVQTLTAAASATLDFTALAVGVSWKLVGKLLVPTTTGDTGWLRFGTGAGPTWSAAGYNYSQAWWGSSASNSTTAAEASAQLSIAGAGTANPGSGLSFECTITTDNANFVQVHGTSQVKAGDGHWYHGSFGGEWPVAVAVTGIRFLFSTGTAATGKLSLYTIAP